MGSTDKLICNFLHSQDDPGAAPLSLSVAVPLPLLPADREGLRRR